MMPIDRQIASAEHDVRVATVDLALVVADMIDAVEIGEAIEPENPSLASYRQDVDHALGDLRKRLEEL